MESIPLQCQRHPRYGVLPCELAMNIDVDIEVDDNGTGLFFFFLSLSPSFLVLLLFPSVRLSSHTYIFYLPWLPMGERDHDFFERCSVNLNEPRKWPHYMCKEGISSNSPFTPPSWRNFNQWFVRWFCTSLSQDEDAESSAPNFWLASLCP